MTVTVSQLYWIIKMSVDAVCVFDFLYLFNTACVSVCCAYLFDIILPNQEYCSGLREVKWEQTAHLTNRQE